MLAACNSAGSESGAAGGPPGGEMPPMPVEVVTAVADTVIDAIQATGQIEAMQQIELRPEVDGRITSILVREGARVGRGTGLFKIDDAELSAEVARARADRDLTRQN